MAISETQVENIVRDVLAQMHVGGNGRAKPATASPGREELALNDSVVTISSLAGRLAGVGRIVVAPDAVVTPAVEDLLKEKRIALVRRMAAASQQAVESSAAAVELDELKREICEIGRRLYAKGFAAGNDGNISYRLSPNEVLCTPTMICKGFMQPEDLCIVDMQGNQLCGKRKRSSEIRLHLTIMRERPDVKSVVHCHPPHATAFAVAREAIPQCVLPEIEVFLGETPITRYETPGNQRFADTVLPFVKNTNVMILANHGTVSYGETVERAYWWTEILDAYCRILMMARDLGKVHYFTEKETRELLELKRQWGFADPRLADSMRNCNLSGHDAFRHTWKETGVEQRAFEPAPPAYWNNPPQEQRDLPATREELVRLVTERVLAAMNA